MPQYAEGQLSKSGKYRMQGGQWVAAGGQAPAAQAEIPPTVQPPLPAVQKAVTQGVDEATGPPPQPSLPWRIAGKALDAVQWPHENLSKPIAAKIDPMLPNVPFKDPGLPDKHKPSIGTPLDVDPKKVISLADIVDFPVYGALSQAPKLLGKARKMISGFLESRKAGEPAAMTLEQAGIAPQSTRVTTGDVGTDLDAVIDQYTAQKSPPIGAEAPAAGPINEPPASPGPLFDPKPPPPKSTIPVPLRQPELFPSPMLSPVRYGPGFGPVEAPPAFTKNFGGNVPQERVGTETAKLKRQMQDIDHIKHLLGVQ